MEFKEKSFLEKQEIPPLVAFLIKYSRGFIKHKSQAIKILLFLAFSLFIFSLFFLFRIGFKGEEVPQKYYFDPNEPTFDIDKKTTP